MNQSKPGQKLAPIIAVHTAKIYAKNPKRYTRLALWVWHQQKAGWADEVIAEAFVLAGDMVHVADDWWSYLTKLLPKASGRAHEAQSNEHKKGDLAVVVEFVEFLKQRQQGKAAPAAPAAKAVERQKADSPQMTLWTKR